MKRVSRGQHIFELQHLVFFESDWHSARLFGPVLPEQVGDAVARAGWREITFWQALGLLALCRILFGGRGGPGFGRSHFRRRMGERWEQMTPEERERFGHGMRGRFGSKPPVGEGKAE